MDSERLQKFMAGAGVASRRKCEELIQAGKVTVNGQTITELGFKVNPASDVVKVNGQLITDTAAKYYVLLNKPVGVLSSASDDRGRKTVVDLVKDIPARIYPVGRLDYDTEGLLLLTNDGELTNGLIHPRYKVDKTYLASIAGKINEDGLNRLRQGIELEDGPTHPAGVKLIKYQGNNSLVEVTIHEGRNRQVRRMFKSIGHQVISLKRVAFAFLILGKLKPGEYRLLSREEVQNLYQLISVPRT